MSAGSLAGKFAVVTGSSRGIGRGTAIALGELGATVFVTGRTTGDGELTIDTTAKMVDDAGGRGIPVRVDHGVLAVEPLGRLTRVGVGELIDVAVEDHGPQSRTVTGGYAAVSLQCSR